MNSSKKTDRQGLRLPRDGAPGELIDWLFFDFDGVLTDNRVWVFDDGREAVCCTRADGLGMSMLRKAGVGCSIVSSERNPVVRRRALKLGIEALQGMKDKRRAVLGFCRKRNLDPARTGFVGNDVNDLPAFGAVGIRLCPSDAAAEIRHICDHILQSKGGTGVAREIARRMGRVLRIGQSRASLRLGRARTAPEPNCGISKSA